MKSKLLSGLFGILSITAFAQSGYEIKIKLKNYKDSLVYLTYYQFDKTLIQDTCTVSNNGTFVFKGNVKLNTGIYALVSQQKSVLFDFFVDDDTQKLEFKSDAEFNFSDDVVALNSRRQNDFLNFIKSLSSQNKKFLELKENTILKTKADTLAFNEKQIIIEKKGNEFEANFLKQSKGTYIASVLNLKIEKVLKEVPNTFNGRPDSIAAFNYYKNHYWDEVDFKNDAVMRNPFFYSKLKKYFDQVVPTHPDSIAVAVDKILLKTNQNSMLFKTMLAYFTNTYETAPIMGYDKVFVYLVDNYFKTGKAADLYSDAGVVKRVIDRAEQIRPLLLGATAQDLLMIKAQDFKIIKEMGFEDARSNEEITKIYYKNLTTIDKMFVKLSDVKAAYTVVVFWDIDCGHCKDEIPVILNTYYEMLNQKIDVKVFSVYMQYEVEDYVKYIEELKLPWINVYDGCRVNNTVKKYDVYATPVIYILDKNKVIKAKRIAADKIGEIIKSLEVQTK